MPEYARALIVIMLLAGATLLALAPAAISTGIDAKDFSRRSALWFALTLLVFLAHSFWVYALVAAILTSFAVRGARNALALFLFIFFTAPPLEQEIPGVGAIRQLFHLSTFRLLEITVLAPAALECWRTRSGVQWSRWPDRFVAAFVLLNVFLQLEVDTFTNTMRFLLYSMLGLVLPYYVASRGVRNLPMIRDAVTSYVVAIAVLSVIAIVEFGRGWLLYSSLNDVLNIPHELGNYLTRGGSVRAESSTGHPIVLGYLFIIAIGFTLYLRRIGPARVTWSLVLLSLIGGLVATISRGPWIGGAVVFLAFLVTGKRPIASLSLTAVLSAAVFGILLLSPYGSTVWDHLPFVGTIDQENILYRERLVELSLLVLSYHPFFGSYDFLLYLQSLRQGQGIVDIVNSYVGIALANGLTGLFLFVGLFALALYGVVKTMQKFERDREEYLLGRVLIATIAGVLVTIYTTSSISFIPVMYWMLAGLCMSYSRLSPEPSVVRHTLEPRKLGVSLIRRTA